MGSTITSAGIIYNQNLKQKLSGSGSVMNLGSGVKNGKIKAEYFKNTIKNGSGLSSNTLNINNNTGSV